MIDSISLLTDKTLQNSPNHQKHMDSNVVFQPKILEIILSWRLLSILRPPTYFRKGLI